MTNNSKIILNTGILYGKMLITMVFTLLSTRWVLEALGESDFGVYNLVAGIIAMFSFLNTAMSIATQRNLSYSLGKGDSEELNSTFVCSVVLHVVLGIIIFLFMAIGGYILLMTVLNVPAERMDVTIIVLITMSLSTFFTIIGVPYLAAINSHENMIVIAIVNIFEAIWKFLLALYLLVYEGDRLLFYSILIAVLSFVSTFLMFLYCNLKYDETKKIRGTLFSIDRIKYLLSYTSWNVIGALGLLTKNMGISFLYNSFYGVTINAAYGISNQVNGQLSFFSNSIIRAFNPQIIKSEGEGNHVRMIKLSCMSCKFSTLLMVLVIVPIIYNINYILDIWLKEVPKYADIFTLLILINSIMYQMSHGFELSIHAAGKIKWFSIISSLANILVIPVGYICLVVGFSKESVLIVSILCTLLITFIIAYYSSKYNNFAVRSFTTSVFIPLCFLFLISLSVCYCCYLFSMGLHRLISCFIFNSPVVILAFYYVCLAKDEKQTVVKMILPIIKRIWN